MALTRAQEKKLLVILFGVLATLIIYRMVTTEPRRTAPLTYQRGAVAASSIRRSLSPAAAGKDPLLVLLERRDERYPGVKRDFFRMANPEPKIRPVPPPVVEPVAPLPPPVPVKTPEEIAAESARADLSKFRFLGYLTDRDSTLFLSKDGELFLVKSGDRVLRNYQVKEAGKDYVILLDTATNVEVRVELTGSEPGQRR